MTTLRSRMLEDLPGIVVFLVLGAAIIAALMDSGLAGLVAAIGFAVVLPLVAIVSDAIRDVLEAEDEPADERGAALDELRARYARGEIDEVEFERRVERLLETETVADAEAFSSRHTAEASSVDREPARE